MTPFVGLCAAFVLATLLARTAGWRRGELVAKGLASAAFLAHDVVVAHPWGAAGGAVFAGLVCGAVGDLALVGRSAAAFRFGLVAFLLGHLAYGVACLAAGVSAWAALGAAVALLPVAAAVWRWLRPRVGRLRGPVAAYVAVICAMVAAAVGTGDPGLIAAAILFFLSDLCVARERFVVSAPMHRWVGLPLYYAAQLLFGTYSP